MGDLYKKLRKLRMQSGLSQKQIADFLETDEEFVKKAEEGKYKWPVDRAEAVANIFGHSLATLTLTDIDDIAVRFVYHAPSTNINDLKAVAEVGKIAANSEFMEEILSCYGDGWRN